MRLSALFGLFAVCAATTARGETMFDTFQAACLKAPGSAEQALSLADSRGWAELSKETVAGIAKDFAGGGAGIGGEAKGFQGRISQADRRMLAVGQVVTAPKDGSLTLAFCVLAGSPVVGEQLKSEAASYAAVPSGKDADADGAYYAFMDDGGKHTQIVNPEDDAVILPAMKSGRARVLVVMEKPGMAMLAFALPVKSSN